MTATLSNLSLTVLPKEIDLSLKSYTYIFLVIIWWVRITQDPLLVFK